MAWDGVVSDVVCEVAWCERELCRRSAALQLFGEVVSQSSAMFMHTLRCLRGYIAELEAVAQVAAPSRLQSVRQSSGAAAFASLQSALQHQSVVSDALASAGVAHLVSVDARWQDLPQPSGEGGAPLYDDKLRETLAAVEEEKRGRAQVAGELRATAATVERLQKQLADAHSACAAATAARDAVAEELRGATLRHQGDAAKAQAALTAAENKARDVLVSGQSAVRALEAQMEADAAAARAEQEERARAARTAHTAEIAALRATHDAELAALHATHERAVAALHASHDAVVQAAVEGVQGRLHAYERSASELGASLSVCHGELSDARAAAAAAHTAAEQQRAHLQQQLDAALRSAAAADQRAQEMGVRLAAALDLESSVVRLSDENAALAARLSDALAAAQSGKSAAAQSEADAKHTIARLQSEITRHMHELQQCRQQLAEAQRAALESDRAVAELRTQLTQARVDRESTARQEGVMHHNALLELESRYLQERLAMQSRAEAAREEQDKQLRAVQDLLVQSEAARSSTEAAARERLHKAESELREVERARGSLQADADNWRGRCVEAERLVVQLQADVASLQELWTASDCTVAVLQKELVAQRDSRKRAALRATSALRDVEGQLRMLTTAVAAARHVEAPMDRLPSTASSFAAVNEARRAIMTEYGDQLTGAK